MDGVIYILNPLYVVILMFLPATLFSFKKRMVLPRWMGIELWKLSLLLMVLLFVVGVFWQLNFSH